MSRLAEVVDQSELHNSLSVHLRAKPKNLSGFLIFELG